MAWVWVLLVISWVTSGSVHNLPMPQFPCVESGDSNRTWNVGLLWGLNLLVFTSNHLTSGTSQVSLEGQLVVLLLITVSDQSESVITPSQISLIQPRAQTLPFSHLITYSSFLYEYDFLVSLCSSTLRKAPKQLADAQWLSNANQSLPGAQQTGSRTCLDKLVSPKLHFIWCRQCPEGPWV